jgi:hypothetical protein
MSEKNRLPEKPEPRRRDFVYNMALLLGVLAVPTAVYLASRRRQPSDETRTGAHSDESPPEQTFKEFHKRFASGSPFEYRPKSTDSRVDEVEMLADALGTAKEKAREMYGESVRLDRIDAFYSCRTLHTADFAQYEKYVRHAISDFANYCGVKEPALRFKLLTPHTNVEPSTSDATDVLIAADIYAGYEFSVTKDGRPCPAVRLMTNYPLSSIAPNFGFEKVSGKIKVSLSNKPIFISALATRRGPVYAIAAPPSEILHYTTFEAMRKAIEQRVNGETAMQNEPHNMRCRRIAGEELAINEAVVHAAQYGWIKDYCANTPRLGLDTNDVSVFYERRPSDAKFRYRDTLLCENTSPAQVRELVQRYLKDPREIARMVNAPWAK